VSGISLQTVGVILMVVGIIGLVMSVIMAQFWTRRGDVVYTTPPPREPLA
jgi:hypothetical protein